MKNYHDLLDTILAVGEERPDRTGTGTLSLFGERLEFDLTKGFPLVTTKKMPFKNIVNELLWFLSGSTNVNDLPESTRPWWKPWAHENGDLGPIYGHQFRNAGAASMVTAPLKPYSDGFMRPSQDPKDWVSSYRAGDGMDQIKSIEQMLHSDPFSRRIVMSTWAPKDIPRMGLAPCHGNVIQFYVSRNGMLSCHMYQRSGDAFIGVPVNIASYALLTHMLCTTHGFSPGKLVISFGDVHLYKNHIEQATLQLTREPLELPKIHIEPIQSILSAKLEDIKLIDYKYHPAIKADVSV